MKMLVQGCKTIGLLTLLAVIGFGLGGTGSPRLEEEKPLSRAILKVCVGCTYGSIQAAVDAAQPGDVVEVYPLLISWPWPPQTWIIDKVVISKPLTLEAKQFVFADLSLEVAIMPESRPNRPGDDAETIFDVTAESGQVTIRGFVLRGGLVSWSGKADLLLERNRFERVGEFGYLVVKLHGGPGRAMLKDNEISEGYIEIAGAEVNLHSNRIKGGIIIRQDYALDQASKVIIERNLIEGTVAVDRSNHVRLEDNILMGLLSPVDGRSVGLGLILASDGRFPPSVVEANRNVIIRYQKGVAVGLVIEGQCKGAPPGELELSGQDNVIEQNGQDLCPTDYPWPPGFRK